MLFGTILVRQRFRGALEKCDHPSKHFLLRASAELTLESFELVSRLFVDFVELECHYLSYLIL